MVTRIFLAVVGAGYIALAIWCAVAPEKTSKGVGYALTPGSGQSEFLTVYGGLELALGMIFLWPLYRPQDAGWPLLACLIIHACLVLFRTAGFLLYTGFPTTTYVLAVVEWLVFLGSLAIVSTVKK